MKTFERYMPHFCLTVLLLCVAGIANASTGNAALTAAAPTTYVDNTPLPASAIVGYNIDCQFTPAGSSTATACTMSPTSVIGSTMAASVTLTYPAATGGKACFRTAAKTAVAVSDLSPLGANSCKDLPAVGPSAPGAVTVTITLALNLTSDTPITVALAGPPVVTRTP